MSHYETAATHTGPFGLSRFVTTTAGADVIRLRHIGSRSDWGANNSAVNITGSPYHMRLQAFRDVTNNSNLSVGNTDRSLSAQAVIFPATITVVKDVTGGEDPQDFNFSISAAANPQPTPATFVLDDDSTSATPSSQTFSLTNFTTYTISETTLAGWTPGVVLDETGRAQSVALAQRLRPLPLAAVVTSPLERCVQTAEDLVTDREGTPLRVDDGLGEARYGDWTGRALTDLAREPLWRVVQAHPSAARFPGDGGESLLDMQVRAVDAVRRWNDELPPGSTWVAVSHADVIKAVVADALGLHLDQFQRIQVDPCSVSVVRYTELRPFVLRVNDTGGTLDGLLPPPPRGRRKGPPRPGSASDAVVGGGAGG